MEIHALLLFLSLLAYTAEQLTALLAIARQALLISHFASQKPGSAP